MHRCSATLLRQTSPSLLHPSHATTLYDGATTHVSQGASSSSLPVIHDVCPLCKGLPAQPSPAQDSHAHMQAFVLFCGHTCKTDMPRLSLPCPGLHAPNLSAVHLEWNFIVRAHKQQRKENPAGSWLTNHSSHADAHRLRRCRGWLSSWRCRS